MVGAGVDLGSRRRPGFRPGAVPAPGRGRFHTGAGTAGTGPVPRPSAEGEPCGVLR